MLSIALLLSVHFPLVFSLFTQTTCTGSFYGGTFGCVQKGSRINKFCYYPAFAGTSGSCNDNNGPLFAGAMTAHLAQGQSIAYYDAANAFLGGSNFPYPSNPGIVYVCVSGSFNDLYQSLCALPGADNAVVPGGTSPNYCMIGLPMEHVDDGCYTVSDAVTNNTTSSSESLTSQQSSSTSAQITESSTGTPSSTTSISPATSTSNTNQGTPSSATPSISPATSTSNPNQGLSKSEKIGVITSVIVAVIGLIAAILQFFSSTWCHSRRLEKTEEGGGINMR